MGRSLKKRQSGLYNWPGVRVHVALIRFTKYGDPMKRVSSIHLTLIISLVLAGCSFGPSESEKLEKDRLEKVEKIKSVIKDMLLDGESAQFSDVKYYKSTNYGCGLVNAKNRMGGYVGKKKFVVALEDSSGLIEPNREMPDPPSAPTYTTPESVMRYGSASAKWQAEIDAIDRKHKAFVSLVAVKCTDPSTSK